MKGALAPIVGAVPDGILRASLPTPFPVGPVNCYLLPDPPVTIVDPGMLLDESLVGLRRLLADAGLRARDVDQVVVSHGHPDHYGAAAWLADRADAPILCGRAEIPKLLESFDGPGFAALLEVLGVPHEVRDDFPGLYAALRELIAVPDESRIHPIDDGDVLRAGGATLEAFVTPGHAVGHMSLYDGSRDVLLSGDHLLPTITPNPVIEPDHGRESGRRQSLVEYLESLERFVDLAPAVVLPGHGPAFSDVAALVSRVRRHHDARAAEIHDIVRELGPATPFEISSRLFPTLEGFGVMLGVSEVAGHLDLLERDGLVEHVSGPRSRYRSQGV